MNWSPDHLQHRRTFVRVLVGLFLVAALCVHVSAQSVVGPKGVAYEERTNDYFVADSFLNFDRPWLSMGPAWLMNAMPGSRLSYLRSASLYDRSGDRIESVYHSASDVGTLANPFNLTFFNNVATYVSGGGTSKTSTPMIADATSTKYWDTGAGNGNGVGGNATWNAQGDMLWSNSSTGDASLSAAATTDAGIFAGGVGGTITLGFSPTLASWTFNSANYTIATTGAAERTITGAITVADGVTLSLAPTPGARLSLNSGLSGGTNSNLILGGTTTTSTDAVVVNLNAGASITLPVPVPAGGGPDSSPPPIPIEIQTDGPGFAGFVASGGSATINASIVNSNPKTLFGKATTLFGAGSGATLNLNRENAGSGSVRFALDGGNTASGTGTVFLGAANHYTGSTVINLASGGSVMLGVNDALSTNSPLEFGASSTSGDVGNLDLNGKNQTIASLESVTTGTHAITNASATSSTLTIGGFGPHSTVFSGVIGGTGANNIALVIHNTALTFSGAAANTYTGSTTVDSGTLNLNKPAGVDAIAGGGLTITNGGVVNLLANDQINNASTVTVDQFGKLDIGAHSETVGNVIVTAGGTITGTTGVLTGSSYQLQNGTVSAILGGSGNLTSTGGTLTGANTYTGTTTVTGGGYLFIDGNQSAATGNVNVNNAGTFLGGYGTIGGKVTVAGGATAGSGSIIVAGDFFSDGHQFGTLTISNTSTGALTLNEGSMIGLALGSSSLEHSTLAHTGAGTISFASNQAFYFLDFGAQAITYDNIITGTGLSSFNTSGWVIFNPGWTGTFSLDGDGNIDLILTSVPEPSTWIGAALALGAVAFTQRRRLRACWRS